MKTGTIDEMVPVFRFTNWSVGLAPLPEVVSDRREGRAHL
jgi:hypothetical protein